MNIFWEHNNVKITYNFDLLDIQIFQARGVDSLLMYNKFLKYNSWFESLIKILKKKSYDPLIGPHYYYSIFWFVFSHNLWYFII